MNNVSLNSQNSQFANGGFALSRSRHSRHAHHAHRSENNEQSSGASPAGGGAAQGTVKQALANGVVAALKQSFDLRQTGIALPGASADEQASGDVAGAVSAALHALHGAPAADAVAAVSGAADGAIRQTTQDLQANAAAAPQLDAAVAQLRDQLQALFSAFLSNTGATPGGSSAAAGVQFSSAARGTLEIRTQEGDTVQLDFASNSALDAQTVQGDSAVQSGAAAIQVYAASGVKVSVQGDLNPDELQAVQDLVGQVSRLAAEFFSGDGAAALAQAGGLSFDGAQLSGYSLSLALQQTFEAYGLNLGAPAPTAAPDAGGTAPSAAVASPADQPAAAAASAAANTAPSANGALSALAA